MTTDSTTEKDPLFSFHNFFRPTSRNVTIWATTIKGLSVTMGGTAVFTDHPKLVYVAMGIGAICEMFLYFTKEEPIDTIKLAVEDLKEESTQSIENVSN